MHAATKAAPALIRAGTCTAADLCYSLQETVFSMLVEITGGICRGRLCVLLQTSVCVCVFVWILFFPFLRGILSPCRLLHFLIGPHSSRSEQRERWRTVVRKKSSSSVAWDVRASKARERGSSVPCTYTSFFRQSPSSANDGCAHGSLSLSASPSPISLSLLLSIYYLLLTLKTPPSPLYFL